MRRSLAACGASAFLALLGLSLYSGAVGVLAPESRRLLGFCAVVTIVGIVRSGGRLRWTLLVAPLILFLTLQTREAGHWCALGAALVAAFAIDAQSVRIRAFLRALATGMLLFAIISMTAAYFPPVRLVLSDFATQLSKALTALVGQPLVLGPSASGVWMWIAYSSLCLGFLLHSKRGVDVGLAGVCVFVGVAALFVFLVFLVHGWAA